MQHVEELEVVRVPLSGDTEANVYASKHGFPHLRDC